MRTRLSVAILLAASCQAASAQEEVVTGFRGYLWGTPLAAIPEIAGTDQAGERDGLAIYAARVRMAGKDALAGFYFHPETGGLVEGAYVFALTLQDCHGVWEDMVGQIEAEYPGLVREALIPTRDEAARRVYDTDCEYYVYNSHRETWTSAYRNPTPPDDHVSLWMRTVERVPRLTVTYRGGAGQAWMDSREERRRGGPR